MKKERPQIEILRRVACWIGKATRAYAHGSAHTPTHTHTHTYVIFIAFTRNNGFVNAPQCYVKRTLPLVFLWPPVRVLCPSSSTTCPDKQWNLGSTPDRGTTLFSYSKRPDRLCSSPSFFSSEKWRLFLGGKAARAWSWPLTKVKNELNCTSGHK